MIILSITSTYSRKTCIVSLTAQERDCLTDAKIVNIVDAKGDDRFANTCNNFGGQVRPLPNGLYEVTVYTD